MCFKKMRVRASMSFFVLIYLWSVPFGVCAKGSTDDLVTNNDATFNAVVEDGENLSLLSLRLFGTMKKFQQIAEWNNIALPYKIYTKQKLILREEPTLNKKEGFNLVVNYWRKRIGVIEQKIPSRKKEVIVREQKKEFKKELEKIKEEAIKDADIPPEKLSAETHFAKGETFFNKEKFGEAYGHFHESRELNPSQLRAWFFEIRCLKKLGRNDEAKKTAELLVDKHAETEHVPFIKKILEE